MPTVRLEDLSRPNDTADQPSRHPKYPMHGMPGMRKGADRAAGAEENRQAPRTSRQRKTKRPAGHNVGTLRSERYSTRGDDHHPRSRTR